MQDKIEIYLLGRFEIRVNGERVDIPLSKAKKGSMLMQYLILKKHEPVSYAELYELLWPDDKSANPESALKTLVSRYRVILGEISEDLARTIQTTRGCYCWNAGVEAYVDVYDFDELSARLRTVQGPLTDALTRDFNRLLMMYNGDLLPAQSDESWLISRSISLQNSYMECVNRYLDLLQEEKNYEEIIRVCRRALEISAFEEQLHIRLMDALVRTGRSNEALNQYKHVTSLHLRYLGMKPPEGIQEFYKQIIRAGQVLDGDISAIRRELSDYEETSGAFVCEYPVFKEIYNLQKRTHERGSEAMFIALLMVTSTDGNPIEPLLLDSVMKILLDVLRSTLRKGDTITHYTAAQFALLLPLKRMDDGKVVIERVKNEFYKKYRTSTVVINYRIGPVKERPDFVPDPDRRALGAQKK